jgi:hypothetical protein
MSDTQGFELIMLFIVLNGTVLSGFYYCVRHM